MQEFEAIFTDIDPNKIRNKLIQIGGRGLKILRYPWQRVVKRLITIFK